MRFLKAVNKLNQHKEQQTYSAITSISNERKALFFNVGRKHVKVFLDEILYIESLREYIRITTKDKSVLTKFKINEMEDALSKDNFLRVHRSFIAAKEKITAFTVNDVEINNKLIPIGGNYKELVLSILKRDC